MAKKKRSKKRAKKIKFDLSLEGFPYHFLLLSVYPAISMFAANVKEADLDALMLPLLLSAAFGIAVYMVLLAAFRNRIKAGAAASVIIASFFSAGHINLGAEKILKISQPLLVLVLVTAAAAGLVYLVSRAGKKQESKMREMNLWVNYIAAALVAIPVFSAGTDMILSPKVDQVKKIAASAPASVPAAQDEPDIYYIILDGHGRSDYLWQIYKYDNREFLKEMQDLGFVIPEKARANYPSTLLSFASFLNYSYLDGLVQKVGTATNNRQYVKDMSKESAAIDFLKEKGYKYYLFPSIHSSSSLKVQADHEFNPQGMNMNEFSQMFLNTTAVSLVQRSSGDKEPAQYKSRRRRIIYDFNTIPETALLPGPKFVFAFIVAPHPPFVFDENGKEVINTRSIRFADGSHAGIPRQEYIEKYAAQVRYVDKMLVKSMKELKKNMKPNSIIIIHGDHGPGAYLDWENPDKTNMGERLTIFSAYYLPNGGDKYLRPDISPVNNFRIILKHYFGQDIELLPDRSYYSRWSTPYEFIDVTEQTR